MEAERLEVLEHDAAVAVHDRLGQAGGARGVDDPQRMVERHRLEGERRRGSARSSAQPIAVGPRALRGGAEARDPHGGAQPGQAGGDLPHHLDPVEDLAVVAVAVDRDEHLRLDLAEPVDHARRAEVRRAGGPDRAEARRGEEGDQRLGDVRHVRGDPVAPADAEPDQAGADPGDLLGAARRSVRVRRSPDSSRKITAVRPGSRGRQRVRRVVDRRAREPAGAGHRPAEHGPVPALAHDLEEVPHRRPELGGGVHRPAPQLVVVLPGPAQPLHEAGDLRLPHHLRRGLPQQRAFLHHVATSSSRPSCSGWTVPRGRGGTPPSPDAALPGPSARATAARWAYRRCRSRPSATCMGRGARAAGRGGVSPPYGRPGR